MPGHDRAASGAADREIVTTRVFDAPRALVFEAWTRAEHIDRWWGPRGFRTATHAFDFRPGGVWFHTMTGPDGATYDGRVVYEEIVPPSRIVLLHEAGGFRMTVTFAEEGGKTRITLHHVFTSAALRDMSVKEFHADTGASETLERLGETVGARDFAASVDRAPELFLSRTFDAPRALVFEAWSKAEHVARWFAPRPLTVPRCEVDLRSGGTFRVIMRMPDGTDLPFEGEFREVVAPERIVFGGTMHDGNTVLTTVTLTERDGKTRMDVHQRYSFASDATRGARQGWTATLDQLGEHVGARH
jgi:uncharacterized protein YndB with AHSA1/START domain